MDNTEVINVLSFCTGYAGLELGLARVFDNPLRCVAVEIEAFAVCNLVAKAESGKLGIEALYTDVKTFPAKEFRGCFDIITAGYPCQPFSHAGKRKGETDPRHLWPFIRDSIEQIEPLLFIGENVAGHLSLGFDRVVSDLEDLGYTTTPGIYAAAETGAPHRRERLFIVAYSSRYGRWCGRWARRVSNGRKISRINGEARESETQSASKEMVNAECTEPRGGEQGVESETTELRRHRPADTGSAVSDAKRGRCDTGSKRAGRSQGTDVDRSGKRSGLADSDCTGCKEQCRTESVQQEHATAERRGRRKWPARPGQDQYDWEQPRTVKPGLGRTIDGFTGRVDELRLLGNGVMPQQFEMALRDILEKIETEPKTKN